MNIKKVATSVVLCAVAVMTGVSVGKNYVDANSISGYSVNSSETELRDASATVSALVSKANDGAEITSFNAIELYQIAEENLKSKNFLKEMVGTTTSASVSLAIKSQRIKLDNLLMYYKLSPSKTMVGITTPNIATKTVYAYDSPNEILVVNCDSSCFTNTSSAENLDAVMTDSSITSQNTYTSKEYLDIYKTTPDSSVVSYIISSKTCGEDNYSDVTSNGDGTYSFTFTFKTKSECAIVGLYYEQEILMSSGYTNAQLQWSSVSMTVTIDENFDFVSITYSESYILGADDLPLGMKTTKVSDSFTEKFYFEETEILSRAFSDFASYVEV